MRAALGMIEMTFERACDAAAAAGCCVAAVPRGGPPPLAPRWSGLAV